MKVRDVPVGRYHVRVATWGEGPSHVVVLAGLAADWHALAPQIRELRRFGHTVHAIALPGFGLAPALRIEDASLPRLADHVTAAVDAIGVRQAAFVGHSLGGGVALRVALARPDLVRGLAVFAPAGVGVSLHWIYKLYCLPLLGRALLQPGRVLRKSSVRRFVVGDARRDDERFVAMLLRHAVTTRDYAVSTRAIVWANQPRRWDRARSLVFPGGEQRGFRIDGPFGELARTPLLVMWGDQDRVICVRDAKRFASLPLAEVHIARGVGHSLPLEAPGWANERLGRFVARLEEKESEAA